MSELEGTVIAGRFRIVRLIGMGGMGAVYEARHVTLPRTLAIKILRPELARDRAFIERFRREAIAASRVEHPNVIHIADFGQTDDASVYLVMEYLVGTGLDDVLSKNRRLPASRALPILAQIADALDLAHQMNVIHRDLKPENILLTEVRGRKDFVKLLDFGIAKVQTPEFTSAPLTIRGEVFGTAEYMSPEQAMGHQVDGRSDIYALGCLTYELLIGDPPFAGSAVEVLRSHVYKEPVPPSTRLRSHRIPPALDALVLRCLAKKPEDRYQTGGELRQDLIRARALIFSMSGETVERSRFTGRMANLSDESMLQGWRRLGGKVPEMLFPTTPNPVLMELPQMGGPASIVAPSSPERLQENFSDAVRELTIALVRDAKAPAEANEALERLLVVEEEAATLTGTIALAEQNFDRIRYEYGQREQRLRKAILNLNIDLSQANEQAGSSPEDAAALRSQIDDLTFQIKELTKSCAEVQAERNAQIRELDQEVKRHQKTRQELEHEAASLLKALQGHVEKLRAAATTPDLQALFEKLDETRAALGYLRV